MPNNAPVTLPFDDSYLRSLVDWQKVGYESLLQAQRIQWEMLLTWQRSLGAVQQELQDQWICRFGGGVPLDG